MYKLSLLAMAVMLGLSFGMTGYAAANGTSAPAGMHKAPEQTTKQKHHRRAKRHETRRHHKAEPQPVKAEQPAAPTPAPAPKTLQQ